MSMFPPPDDAYQGSRLAVAFLWLQVAINAMRGMIHVFLPDSGAGRIAGIDLSVNGEPVVSLLAQIGLDQLVWGAIELAVLLRYRRWIPVVLGILLVKQLGAAWLLWLWKPLGVEAPGKFGALVGVPIVALAFWLSLPRRHPDRAKVRPDRPEPV